MTLSRSERLEQMKDKVTVEVEYNMSDLECILISFWEGGYSPWVRLATINHPTIPNTVKEYHDKHGLCTSEYAFDALLEGGNVEIQSEHKEYKGTLTLENFKAALAKFAKEHSGDPYPFINDGKIDAGNIDAPRADSIVQLALFGEEVFG